MSERFKRLSSSIDYYYCVDTENNNQGLTERDMLNELNALDSELELCEIIIAGMDSMIDALKKQDYDKYLEYEQKTTEECMKHVKKKQVKEFEY